jgi:hypothetical protein
LFHFILGCIKSKVTVIANERSPEGASDEAIRKARFTKQNRGLQIASPAIHEVMPSAKAAGSQ